MSAYHHLNEIWSGKVAPQQQIKIGSYVVPKLCPEGHGAPNYPPAYNTLSHGVGMEHRMRGYFSLSGAYPFATCESCKMEMTERPCMGQINCTHTTAPSAGADAAPVVSEVATPAPVPKEGETIVVDQETKEVIEGYLRGKYGRRRR